MYVCGPTVYDLAHIGNARPAWSSTCWSACCGGASAARHLRPQHHRRGRQDQRARAARAASRSRRSRRAPRPTTTSDMAALGLLPPDVEPRATGIIAHIIALIERLIERGHAYAAEGHVLFSVPSFPDYGALSRPRPGRAAAPARGSTWRRTSATPATSCCGSPRTPACPAGTAPGAAAARAGTSSARRWRGRRWARPSTSTAAASTCIFPHHENEMAQSRCAFGTPRMANVWLHNGMLRVGGEKMSKSLGNFLTVRDILGARRLGRRGVPAARAAHALPPADGLHLRRAGGGQGGARRRLRHAGARARARPRRRRRGPRWSTGRWSRCWTT